MSVREILILGLAAASAALSAPGGLTPELGHAARVKIERIEQSKMKPGEKVSWSEDELNSLLKFEYGPRLPPGVREPALRLYDQRVEVHALVDLAKLAGGSGGSLGLWAMLFGGEQPLKAVCRPISGDGRAKIEVVSVELGGRVISGSILSWLLAATIPLPGSDGVAGNVVSLPDTIRDLRMEAGRATIVTR